jgi:hypothetical protein
MPLLCASWVQVDVNVLPKSVQKVVKKVRFFGPKKLAPHKMASGGKHFP